MFYSDLRLTPSVNLAGGRLTLARAAAPLVRLGSHPRPAVDLDNGAPIDAPTIEIKNQQKQSKTQRNQIKIIENHRSNKPEMKNISKINEIIENHMKS